MRGNLSFFPPLPCQNSVQRIVDVQHLTELSRFPCQSAIQFSAMYILFFAVSNLWNLLSQLYFSFLLYCLVFAFFFQQFLFSLFLSIGHLLWREYIQNEFCIYSFSPVVFLHSLQAASFHLSCDWHSNFVGNQIQCQWSSELLPNLNTFLLFSSSCFQLSPSFSGNIK